MSEHKEVEPTFASFKGLGYVSMVKGVPLWPLLSLFGAGLVGTVALWPFIGIAALVWPLLCASILLALRVLCETDNKAMERARWTFKAWALRFKKTSTVLTVSPNKSGSKHERFCKQLKKIHRAG